jgi:hypothetical protein
VPNSRMPGTTARGSSIWEAVSRRWAWVVGPAAVASLVAIGPATPAPGSLQPRTPACNLVSNSDVVAAGAAIDTGQYTITMVATGGQSTGASVHGGLWFTAQGVTHESAGTAQPHRPAPGKPLEAQYGSTEVDLTGVGVSVSSGSASQAPNAHSVSSDRPGVLVWHRGDSAHSSPAWRLLIATVSNDTQTCKRGDPCWDVMPTSGPGAVLDVRRISADGLAGSWRSAASSDVHGYFCVVPVRYYSPYQSRYLPQGPQPH